MREADMASELKRRLPEILPAGKIVWQPREYTEDRQVELAADLVLRDHPLKLLFEMKGQPNLASLRNAIEHLQAIRQHPRRGIPIVVAPHFNPEMRKLCRKHSQAYLDLSGNAWIDTGRILIDKEVAKNLFPHQAKRRSPFADKATLVLRYLLDQEKQAGRVREIARAVNLSPGYVSTVVESAVDSGFARIQSDGRIQLSNLHEMLLDWSAAYSWKKNDLQSYFGTFNGPDQISDALLRALKGKNQHYALTLHAGNNLVEPFAPFSVSHLYVRNQEVKDHIVRSLKLEPVARDAGNVVFLTPHYRESAFYGSRKLDGLSIVSDLQLFLDLRRFPVRGDESSEIIFERRLRPRWEKVLA
jgi:hypothetical protein